MDTPDTEWKVTGEKVRDSLTFIEKLNGKEIVELENAIDEALSSHDTYWKERVRVLVSKNTGQDEFDVVEFLNALNNLK